MLDLYAQNAARKSGAVANNLLEVEYLHSAPGVPDVAEGQART